MASSSKRLHDSVDINDEESENEQSDEENDTRINKNPKKFAGSFTYKVKFKAE